MTPRLYERLYGLRIPLLIGLIAAVAICVFAVAGGGSWLAAQLGGPKPVAQAKATDTAVVPPPKATVAATNTLSPAPTQPLVAPTSTQTSVPTPSPVTPPTFTPAPTLPKPTLTPTFPVPTATPTFSSATTYLPPAGFARVPRRTVGGVYAVQWQDWLWAIAEDLCSAGPKWSEIYQANRDKISNPNLIYSGQQLRIPCAQR